MSNNLEENTFNIYELLRDRLMYPSILYIPMDIVLEYADYEDVEVLQRTLEPFDKMWISESLEINYLLEADTDLKLLLKKQEVLKKNLFDIIDYKKHLESDQFLFLEKRYKEFLFVCMYFSQEMVAAIEESKDIEITKYLKLFDLQKLYYQNHFSALEEAFPTSEEEKKMWYNQDNFNYEHLKDNISFETELKSKFSKKPQKKNQKVISDVESQKYLLTTVFNINVG